MSVIIVLMAASLSVAAIFLAAFLWAVRTDQFEDTHTPAMRLLNEDREQKISNVK
jgi:cbb3-type cytochrome oxidase maturation protein